MAALPLPGKRKGGRFAQQNVAQRQAPIAGSQSVRSKHSCDRPVSTPAYATSTGGAPSTVAQLQSHNNRIVGRFFPPSPPRHMENKTDEEKDTTSHWIDFQPSGRASLLAPTPHSRALAGDDAVASGCGDRKSVV